MAQEQQQLSDAISRARVAARRMVLAKNLADDTGVQIAFQAILFNLWSIGEGVKALPPEVLARVPDFPWADYAAAGDLIQPTFHHIVPAEVQRTLESALDPLEDAVSRIATQR